MIDFAHVGLQKTGSKWLQYGIFDQHLQLEVFGHIIKGHRLEKLGYLVRDLYSLEFNKSSWINDYQRFSTDLLSNRVVGISNEQLSGHIFDTPLGLLVANRLRDLFGDIKIILVLRNPVTFIQSAYVQSIKSGTVTVNFHTFLSDQTMCEKIISRVNFQTLIDKYQALFSEVLVLPYELLKDDSQVFLDLICNFLEVDNFVDVNHEWRNTRIPFILQEVMRQTNRIDLAIWPRDRYISRLLKRTSPLLSTYLPKMPAISLLDLEPYGFEFLVGDNYKIWQGELAKYNYFQ